MIKDFVYNVPTKVYFGRDQLENLSNELLKYGRNVLLTYGSGSIKKNGLYTKLMEILNKENFNITELSGIKPNPRIESVREGVRLCRENKIDVILAVGGGSTIDCSKFIAAGYYSEDDPWKLVTGENEITNALPLISVLTLAATGSEMDAGGVISNLETNEKIGNGSVYQRPKVSFEDPTLTFSVNKYQTACGAVDMFSHIIEVYFNNDDQLDIIDGFCESMMKSIIKNAPIAMENPKDYNARANLMWISSWAINGFIGNRSNQSWSCHPIEHELSAFYDITHGLGLAILTPRWLEYCLDENTVDKYYNFGVNVFDIDKNKDKFEVSNEAIERLKEFFFETLGLDSKLSDIGIDDKNFEKMANKACKNKYINGFKKLYPADVKEILDRCL